jgi:hypothetical protein
MRLRFTSCWAGALLLHAGLLALGSRSEAGLPPQVPIALESRETEVELFPFGSLDPQPPALPAAPSDPPPTRSVAPEAQPKVVARASRPRSDAAVVAAASSEPGAAAAASAVASSAEQTAAPEAATEPRPGKRLSPLDLGLSPGGGAFVQHMRDVSRAAPSDPGQLQGARMARDTELGLGPGGAVASAVRASAYELAPLESRATISVDLDPDGSIRLISLVDVSSNDAGWNALLRALRKDLARLSVKTARPLRVTLLLTNRSTQRAGSGGLLDFDLSNIGSPMIQSLHVRVLAQTPL